MINLDTILAANNSIVVEDGGSSITVDGTVELGATSLAALESITVVDGGGSLTVDAADLDIRDLVFATDKVDVSGSEVSLDSATLSALENITVSATDLDIRDLAFATDKVDVSGSTISTVEAGYGTWSVTAVSVTTTESSITALGSRLKLEIQNLGANDIYIRHITGVTTSNGLKIHKGSSYEQYLAAGASVFMVSASGTADVRIAQYAV